MQSCVRLFFEMVAQRPALQFVSMVAKWHIFKPKIPIRVNFGEPWNGKCWYVLCPFEIF
jgi:hypothetical protein